MSAEGRRPLHERLRFPTIRLESAALSAWLSLALVSVVATRIAPARVLRPANAALRDGLIVGQLAAAGLVTYGAVALWQRFGPRRAAFGHLAIAVASLAIAGPILRNDLANLATKVPLPYEVARTALALAVAAAVPIAALLGRLAARPWVRIAPSLVALGMAIASHVVLPDDYPGMHLVAAMASAALFGAAIATPDADRKRYEKFVVAALVPIAAWALLFRPPSTVAVAVQRVPGDVIAPWLARLRDRDDSEIAARDLGDVLLPREAVWWKSRDGSPPVPASSPRLLARNPIVVLITIDCMRADVLAGKSHEKALPSLFALRDTSVAFEEARATATATTQSVAAIFTGRYYSELYWKPRPNWNPEAVYPDGDPTPRFTELLVKAGIRTATISGMPGLTKEFGIVKGFEEETIIKGGRGFAAAGQIMPKVIERLIAQGPDPLFLYVHFTDAHAPYDHASKKGTPFERYLRGLARVDRELGKLLRRIDLTPSLQTRTAVFLSADHGEAFGEHGSQYHATTIYDELLRVPLLARLPGVPARSVAKRVSLIDLAPTMLDLFGVDAPGELMGQSLVPFFRGEDPVLTRPIVADSSRLQRAVVFQDGFKIIRDRRRDTVELYDLRTDPTELHDIFDESGPAGEARLHALRAFFQAHTLKRPGYVVPYGR